MIHYTRIQAARADGYRLVIFALGAGFFLYLLSTLIAPILALIYDHCAWATSAVDWAAAYISLDSRFRPLRIFQGDASSYQFLVSCLALGLSAPIASVINGIGKYFPEFSEEAAVEKAIISRNDPIEIFLNQALKSGDSVLATLNSGKVYVGTVIRDLNPIYGLASIELELIKSGFRSQTTHKVSFTTDYTEVEEAIKKRTQQVSFDLLEQMIGASSNGAPRPGLVDEILEDLHKNSTVEKLALQRVLIVPYREIQSIRPFSNDVFEEHQAKDDSQDDDSLQ